MHVSLENLLALRDGEIAADEAGLADAEAHLQSCPECTAELARLKRVRDELRALPPEIPPASAWEGIDRQLDAQGRRNRAWWTGGLALAASLVAGVALWMNLGMNLGMNMGVNTGTALSQPAMVINTDPANNIATDVTDRAPATTMRFSELPLRARSQLLEQRLRSMRPESRVLTGHDAMTAVELEDLIALVDYQLARTRSLDDQRAKQLWQQRVDLMSGLVQVREQGTRSRGRMQNASYRQ